MPTLSPTSLLIPTVAPGFALVKIKYSCIEPSDRANSIGAFPKTIFSRIPGRDYSGTVIELKQDSGARRSEWIGKTVYGTGGAELGFNIDGPHAQYCLIPENMLIEKPDTISLLQGATVGVPFTTALRGAVGSAAVQLAQATGCRRILTATRNKDENPDVLLKGDIDTELQTKLPSLTDGKGVDVVVDTIGNLDIMNTAIHALAIKGRYAWITALKGGVPMKLSLDIFEAYRKEIELVGCNTGLATTENTAEEMKILTHLFKQNLIHPQAESSMNLVDLDDAIEKGYKTSLNKKQTVLTMD
ncbi:uncharacterized protein N7479_009336 [Penicillium vulpinum]|uniref:uncharacterized protein n=1 Tax=Penicillium vulpinum TaxID=29845 RepID=UPI002548770B|nr:uncharacterized protein N7479_009336 [Penicillium vulpinum]KAJ5950923.1 hypothetical protein N7479_009336 [Penicillium vulpinum]